MHKEMKRKNCHKSSTSSIQIAPCIVFLALYLMYLLRVKSQTPTPMCSTHAA